MSNPADAGINLNYLANVRPSSRQLAWQRMEMYAFLHFGMNTMTDREWASGMRIRHCSTRGTWTWTSGWTRWWPAGWPASS